MDITSSQKKSTPSSVTTDKGPSGAASHASQRPRYADLDEPYDRSFDLVEQVRQAREAAEKKMNAFSGNLADYVLVRKIVGQKSVRERQRKLEEESQSVVTGEGDRQLSLELDKARREESK